MVRAVRRLNIPLCLIPLWDVELAAAETQRNADRGVRAICFSELPHHLKLPTIHSGYWDPLFQVCNDNGVTVCMHIGSSSTNPPASPDAPERRRRDARLQQLRWRRWPTGCSPAKLIEFPKLKLAYSEGQIGWIPYVLERADTVWEHHDSWQNSKERIPEPPSTYYYGRIFGCFTADHHGLAEPRRGRPRQHLLRDRLPAHRHHVAALEGVRREDAGRPRRRGRPTRCCGATPSRCWSSTAPSRRGQPGPGSRVRSRPCRE